jgi:hypothetical protein
MALALDLDDLTGMTGAGLMTGPRVGRRPLMVALPGQAPPTGAGASLGPDG